MRPSVVAARDALVLAEQPISGDSERIRKEPPAVSLARGSDSPNCNVSTAKGGT
jgi:hypothetical protein